MIPLLKKELKMLFSSPLAYIVAAAFSFFNGYVFWMIVNLLAAPGGQIQSDILSLYFGGTFFFWISLLTLVPLLTMRLVSEEKKSGTLELLLTSPVTDVQIVLAKFLSVFLFYLFLWIPSFLYTFAVISLGSFDWGIWIACLTGVCAIGAFLLSFGLMCSAFFSQQLAAGMVCFAFLMLYFLFGFGDFFQSNAIFKMIWETVWPLQTFQDLGSGQMKSKHLIFLTAFTIFHLYVTVQILGSRRWKN